MSTRLGWTWVLAGGLAATAGCQFVTLPPNTLYRCDGGTCPHGGVCLADNLCHPPDGGPDGGGDAGCFAQSCQAQGLECGRAPDGCECGGCPAGKVCGGSGTANR